MRPAPSRGGKVDGVVPVAAATTRGTGINWQGGPPGIGGRAIAARLTSALPTRPALVAGGLAHHHGSPGGPQILGAEGLLHGDCGLDLMAGSGRVTSMEVN